MKKQTILMFFSILVLSGIITSCTKNEVTGISLSDSSLSLTLGEEDTIVATPTYSGNIVPSVQWTSSDSSVATVKDGIVDGVSKGSATITATAGSKTTTCSVTIDDHIYPHTTQGILFYQGDYYQQGISNNFIIFLAGPNINFNDVSTIYDDEKIYIEVNTSDSITDNIPDSLYQINTNFEPGTLVRAWSTGTTGGGTWYVSKKNTSNPIMSGEAVISKTNGVYQIDYEFVDYFGNTISGSHVSMLYYDDISSSVSSTSISAINKIKSFVNPNIFKSKVPKDFTKLY